MSIELPMMLLHQVEPWVSAITVMQSNINFCLICCKITFLHMCFWSFQKEFINYFFV